MLIAGGSDQVRVGDLPLVLAKEAPFEASCVCTRDALDALSKAIERGAKTKSEQMREARGHT